MKLNLKFFLRGLNARLIILAAIPFIAYGISSTRALYAAYLDYLNSETSLEVLAILESSSNLIRELQKERALSSRYVTGESVQAEMMAQRTDTSKEISHFDSLMKTESLTKEARERVNNKAEFRSSSLPAIDAKIPRVAAVSLYNTLIADYLWFQSVANHNTAETERVARITALENAKENASLLRDLLTGAAFDNLPMSEEQSRSIYNIKSVFESQIVAPSLSGSIETAETVDEIAKSQEMTQIHESFRNIIDKSHTGNYGESSSQIDSLISSLIKQIDQLIQKEYSTAISSEAKRHSNSRSKLMLEMVLLTIVSGIIFAYLVWVFWSVTRFFKTLIDNLLDTAFSLQESSHNLLNTSRQLSVEAKHAASSLEDTTASLEELTATERANAEETKRALTESKASEESAAQGQADILPLVAAMKEISGSTKKIEDIISVIEDVAFQTNLLALNAAVEAARAGEKGKGFAVVADAIRTLSSRTSTSAKEITVLINDSVERIKHGTELADNCGSALSKIVSSISQVSQTVVNVQRASQEQSIGVSKISQAMNQIDKSTQGSAKSSVVVSDASTRLNEEVESLQNNINLLVQFVGSHESELLADSRENSAHRSNEEKEDQAA